MFKYRTVKLWNVFLSANVTLLPLITIDEVFIALTISGEPTPPKPQMFPVTRFMYVCRPDTTCEIKLLRIYSVKSVVNTIVIQVPLRIICTKNLPYVLLSKYNHLKSEHISTSEMLKWFTENYKTLTICKEAIDGG